VILGDVQEQLAGKYRLSACGRLHNATQRFASFLRKCAGGTNQASVLLTQLQVADMLGLTGSTIVIIANQLRAVGAIRYLRGSIVITSHGVLASQACGCHKRLAIDTPKMLPEWISQRQTCVVSVLHVHAFLRPLCRP
jgi:hypothetical protein